MRFQDWLVLQESNLQDLYASTVQAFPRTTKRQHATDPIRIVELNWTPFLGVKTLFIKGLAQSGESGKEYNTLFLFKNVNYNIQDESKAVRITASDGQEYLFEQLSLDNTEVLVRCSCPDFAWRFNYMDHLDDSLYGRKRKEYHAIHNPGSSNPLQLPGMCKHLIKCATAIVESGAIHA